MKLLFDAMLSPQLPQRVADIFPDSGHVDAIGLHATDSEIWDFASLQGFAIVTKDNDFQWRAEVVGPPPKVIMVRLGNCRTGIVESLIRMSLRDIEGFLEDATSAILILPLS